MDAKTTKRLFQEGWSANIAGKGVEENPYTGEEAQLWFSGWDTAENADMYWDEMENKFGE